MTPGELKFALLLESKLNSIPDPEYRQLVVEVLMVVGLVAMSSSRPSFGHSPIVVDHLINLALHLFIQDQVSTCTISRNIQRESTLTVSHYMYSVQYAKHC